MFYDKDSSSMDYSNRMTVRTIQTATTFRKGASAHQRDDTAPSRVACQNGEGKTARAVTKMLFKYDKAAVNRIHHLLHPGTDKSYYMNIFYPKTTPKQYTKCLPDHCRSQDRRYGQTSTQLLKMRGTWSITNCTRSVSFHAIGAFGQWLWVPLSTYINYHEIRRNPNKWNLNL